MFELKTPERHDASLRCDEDGSMTLLAAAKVNLYLEVLERRPSGYHEIRSMVVPVSLYDRLRLVPAEATIRTTVEVAGGIGAEGLATLDPVANLATRAARELKTATGYSGGIDIHLHKAIPVGGGLGGGSADAAAVLRGLRAVWELDLSDDALAEIGSRVGCDVPALVQGGAVCLEGVGDRTSRIAPGPRAHPGWWIVLVNPKVHVSTADIYTRCTPPLTSPEIPFKDIVSAWQAGDTDLAAQRLFNGLESIVFKKYPLIELVSERLRRAGALGALLCGSGASVFGLARNRAHAAALAARFREKVDFPYWIEVVQTLPDGVMVAHGPLEARV